ncbi:O-antigen ligase family protein [Paenibacillus eucommiae]|uniref:O-antigen ligase domain-containing protein n=1 Tax=Paenibacillus eucommiae TaxID=1355755 RepID=A0ABS4IRT6_9BACL|nr:O-antigen ligase family protein [Paenibacillus eucommiae]MBP1990289.1 hypothetical protein [Paenibacillus eucommiae]
MKAIISEKNPTLLIMLFPLLYILMPRPSIDGVQFLTYPFLGIVAFTVIALNIRIIKLSRNLLYLLSLTYLLIFSLLVSMIFSENPELILFFYVVKPFLFSIILIFGFVVGERCDYNSIRKGLLRCAYVILIVQIIVGIPQLFSLTLFNPIYSAEMARPIGEKIRIVGTMGNPNIFAWVVIQSSVIIFLMEESKVKQVFGLLLGFILVILSGSRTALILLPFVILACSFLMSKKDVKFYIFKIPMYTLTLIFSFYIIIKLIEKYGSYLPYLNQLLQIIDTGKLSSINSFEARTFMWDNAWNEFVASESLIKWLFGIGLGFFKFIDSDIIYSIVSYGIVGTALNLLIYFSLLLMFSKVKQRQFSVLGKQYILFSLIIGYQAETLSGWNYPLLIMFYAGVAISLIKNQSVLLAQNGTKDKLSDNKLAV